MKKNSLSKFLFVGGWGVAVMFPSFSGADPFNPQVPADEKIAIEQSLELKGQRTLDAMLGPGKARLIIMADIIPSATQSVEMTSNKNQTRQGVFGWRDPKSGAPILPGFNEDTPLTAVPTSVNEVSRVSTVSRFNQKITGTVLLDRAVEQESASKARGILFRTLSLDEGRGDSVEFLTVDHLGETVPEKNDPVRPRRTWMVTAVVTALGMCLLVLWRWPTRRGVMLPTAGPVPKGEGHRDSMSAGDKHEPGTLITAPGKSAFGHLRGRDRPAVVAFLEEQPFEDSAAIISFLPPEFSAEVLTAMPVAVRASLFKTMAGDFQIPPDRREILVKRLASFVESYIRGPEVLAGIIETVSDKAQAQLKAEVAALDPKLKEAIERTILSVSDVWRLGKAEWGAVATSLSTEDLATVLKEATPEDQTRLSDALPPQFAALVKQHLRLGGSPTTAQATLARKKMFAIVRSLMDAGKLNLARERRA